MCSKNYQPMIIIYIFKTIEEYKTNKIKFHSESCIVIDYPKGTRSALFYNLKDNKIFVKYKCNLLGKWLYKELQTQK